MIKRRRQLLGRAAVANVDANYVKAGAKGFGCRGQHVWGRGRAFHAMPHDQRGVLGAVRLPATTRQHTASGLYFKQTLFIVSEIARAEASRPKVGSDSLRVALFENRMRNERLGVELRGDFCEQ